VREVRTKRVPRGKRDVSHGIICRNGCPPGLRPSRRVVLLGRIDVQKDRIWPIILILVVGVSAILMAVIGR